MPITLTLEAEEKSTYIANVEFWDEDGNAVVPNVITWHLVNGEGTVINGLTNQSETPATSVDIVLTGDDLQIVGSSAYEERQIIVEWTYDSTLGTLDGKESISFRVNNLAVIT